MAIHPAGRVFSMIGGDVGWARFTHPLLGFSVEHPKGWEPRPDSMGAALVVLSPAEEPVPFRPNLTVTIARRPDEGSLDDYVAQQEDRASVVLTDFKVRDRREASIGDMTALKVSGRYRQGKLEIELAQWHIERAEAIVTVSAAAEDELWAECLPTFERIAGSFELAGAS